MNRTEWIRRYHAMMENAWTAAVIVEPSPEETAAIMLLAREIRQGLAAGLLGTPAAVGRSDCDSCPHNRHQHATTGCTWTDPDGTNPCPCSRTYMDLHDDPLIRASLPLCPRPSAHMPAEHTGQWPDPRIRADERDPRIRADERDEPNGEQADPIITQPLAHIAERLADDIRAVTQFVPNLRACHCPGCTTARKINAKVAERDALT